MSISIYNAKGQVERKLIDNKELIKGSHHSVYWDGTDYQGRNVGSGLYLYRLTPNTYNQTKKMLLVK